MLTLYVHFADGMEDYVDITPEQFGLSKTASAKEVEERINQLLRQHDLHVNRGQESGLFVTQDDYIVVGESKWKKNKKF